MVTTAIAMAATLALALAQIAPDQTLVLRGAYVFTTDAQSEGRPLCTETWTFGPDGTQTVESGQEVVRKNFRTETDRVGHWLVSRTQSTNGRPDCMGQASAEVSSEERRTFLVPFNGGVIVICPPPAVMADGAPYVSGCFGAIRKVPESG